MAVKTVLVTSVGGRVGDDVLSLLEPLRDRLRVVGVNSVPRASQNFRCDRTYLVPPTAQRGDWLAAMRGILRAERPDLVLPLRDGDLAAVAALKTEPEFAGTVFHCADAGAVELMIDKAATAAFARAQGLIFADTVTDPGGLDALIERRGFPLIAKPRTGSGAHGVRLVRSHAEAAAALGIDGYIVQEFIDPPASMGPARLDLSAGLPFFFVLPDRSHLSAIAGIAPDGRADYVGCLLVTFKSVEAAGSVAVDSPEIARVTLDWATALAKAGARGVLNVQCRKSPDRGYVPFEINGRVPGGAITRRLFGQDGLAGALAAVFGHDPIVYPRRAAPGWRSDRIFQVAMIDPSDVARLEAEGMWTRA